MREKYLIQVKIYKKIRPDNFDYDFPNNYEFIEEFISREFNRNSIELLRDDISRMLKMISKHVKKEAK